MIKKINILVLILISTIISCGLITDNSKRKKMLDKNEISKIEIKINPTFQTNKKSEIRELSDLQIDDFVNKWNNSISVGPCKTRIKYWIFVKMKNGEIRTFRANIQNIKENNDWCYKIKNELFFKDLFENSEDIPEYKKKDFELLQGFWVHDKDSLSSISIINYDWTFNYSNTQTDLNNKYYISLTNKLTEFVNKEAEFIILTNKNDTIYYEILGLNKKTLSLMHYPSMRIHLYHNNN